MSDDNLDDNLVKFDGEIATYQKVVSSFSTVCSSLILITAFMFPALRKREIYFQLIVFMSFNDFLFSLVGSWGATANMTMCTIQAGFTQFFTVATFMFVMMLTITIFCHFQFKRRYLNLWYMVGISWSVALICTCLPLANKYVTYSSRYFHDLDLACYIFFNFDIIDDDDSTRFAERFNRFQLWKMAFTGVLPLVIIAIMFGLCAFLYLITLPRISEEDPEMALRMKRLVNYIVLYPIALTLCFAPACISDIYYTANDTVKYSKTDTKIESVLYINYYWYGFIASLIFFLNASSAREMWRRWFVRNIGKRWCNMEEENDLLKDFTPEELDELDDHDIDEAITERALSLTFSDYRGSVTRSSRSRSRNRNTSALKNNSLTSTVSSKSAKTVGGGGLRGSTVSLGAGLRDTIPEAIDSGAGGTLNPIVSAKEEEEEEGYRL